MPSCLRELFEQTSSEQQNCFANNAHSSTKSFKSILKFNGMELPPPLVRFSLLKIYYRVLMFDESKLKNLTNKILLTYEVFRVIANLGM
jgi:hypothetical protein